MSVPESVEFFDLNSDNYGDILEAYETLWSLFRNTSGLEVKGTRADLDISHENEEKVVIGSDSYFKIKGVGFEAGSAGPIDICFKPDMTVIGVEYDGSRRPIIESSATAVSYLEVSKSENELEESSSSDYKTQAKVLSAFHYDFDMDPDGRHPVFHAHYEPSSIQLGTLSTDYNISNESHVTDSFPNHPRVPTAPLDFAGVLNMLIQEHIDEFETAWPNGTINAVKKLPKLPAWCFEPDPISGTNMLSEWWYLLSRDENGVPEEIVESRGIH